MFGATSNPKRQRGRITNGDRLVARPRSRFGFPIKKDLSWQCVTIPIRMKFPQPGLKDNSQTRSAITVPADAAKLPSSSADISTWTADRTSRCHFHARLLSRSPRPCRLSDWSRPQQPSSRSRARHDPRRRSRIGSLRFFARTVSKSNELTVAGPTRLLSSVVSIPVSRGGRSSSTVTSTPSTCRLCRRELRTAYFTEAAVRT